MPSLAYVDGRYGPVSRARVAAEDRGLQFGDAVYEVVAMFGGVPLDWEQHLRRLRRGLAALFIEGVPGDAALARISGTLWRRSRLSDGLLYIQATRGEARRDHPFPKRTRPTLILTARPFDFRQRIAQQQQGVATIALPDQRWLRSDLKTTNLLGAVLAKQEAREAGAFEAIFHLPDGTVTEGGSTNVWMVDASGALVTHPLSNRLLGGIMRETTMRLARDAQMPVTERAFTLAEARAAPELFLTSTTAPVVPIVSLDGAAVGTGAVGPVATRLAGLLWAEVTRQTGWRP
jgi:D-alanine transaminase